MIITKLQGGLGNQMFQYAIGRFLIEKNNTELKLDTSWFNNIKNNTTQRKYGLGIFNITENTLNSNELKKLKKYEQKNGWRYFFHNLFFADKSIYIKENNIDFNKSIAQISGNVYLDGYWQGEKYFKNIENIIRKKFTLKNKFQIKNNQLKQEIINTNSVSVHIRRDDYVNNENINKVHGLCSLNYYQRALQKISEQNDALYVFVFSDDIEWARNNLKTGFPITFISGNKDYEDLILMSLCKHNIIANSSFSWWGAWLNKNPNKIVIAPKKWFNDPNKNIQDLIPKSWIQI